MIAVMLIVIVSNYQYQSNVITTETIEFTSMYACELALPAIKNQINTTVNDTTFTVVCYEGTSK